MVLDSVIPVVPFHSRQQIEDCENEVRRLKEMLKKKDESEKKYQGVCPAMQVHVVTIELVNVHVNVLIVSLALLHFQSHLPS